MTKEITTVGDLRVFSNNRDEFFAQRIDGSFNRYLTTRGTTEHYHEHSINRFRDLYFSSLEELFKAAAKYIESNIKKTVIVTVEINKDQTIDTLFNPAIKNQINVLSVKDKE